MKPTHIKGTWQNNDPWLGHFKLIASDQEITPVLPQSRDIICPVCEYPEAVHLSMKQDHFKLMYYCPECGIVFAWYVAKCPDCGGSMWNKECDEGTVTCSLCGMNWNQETVQEINEEDDNETDMYDGT